MKFNLRNTFTWFQGQFQYLQTQPLTNSMFSRKKSIPRSVINREKKIFLPDLTIVAIVHNGTNEQKTTLHMCMHPALNNTIQTRKRRNASRTSSCYLTITLITNKHTVFQNIQMHFVADLQILVSIWHSYHVLFFYLFLHSCFSTQGFRCSRI